MKKCPKCGFELGPVSNALERDEGSELFVFRTNDLVDRAKFFHKIGEMIFKANKLGLEGKSVSEFKMDELRDIYGGTEFRLNWKKH